MKRLALTLGLVFLGVSGLIAGSPNTRSSAMPVGAPKGAPAIANDDANKATIAFLLKLQTPEGGFVAKTDPNELTSLAATLQARRALYFHGVDVPRKDECVKFVMRCFNEAAGALSETATGSVSVGGTVNGLMLLQELGQTLDKVGPRGLKYLEEHVNSFEEVRLAAACVEQIGAKTDKKAEWIKIVRKGQDPDGSFGLGSARAHDTGSHFAALVRLGDPVPERDTVLKIMDAGQRKDGAFSTGDGPSALDATYRTVRGYYLMKAKPANVNGLRDFIASCRNADGGYGIMPGQASSVNGTYYASIIRYWLAQN